MLARVYVALVCKILVVDDESDVRESLCIELASFGHDVVGAADGVEALSWLGANQVELPCIVLLDLLMPNMDGCAFLEQLRARSHFMRLPVIVLSAASKHASVVAGISAQAVWQKPPAAGQLEKIQTYCERHRRSELLPRN